MNAGEVGARRAAEHLRHLLQVRPAYARAWRAHANHASTLSQSAVARVLAAHLWESGEADEHDLTVPRRLKDAVSRALSGRHLSARTLTWFIEAFEMSPEDAQALWALRLGGEPEGTVAVVHGHARPPVEEPPARHRTLSLNELHVVGDDGLPEQHRTIQVLLAVQTLERYPFRFDTDVAAVQVLRGGRAGPLRRDAIPGLYAVDIELTRAVPAGQTTALEYATTFAYRSAPPPEFRRGAYRPVESVEIGVQFSGRRLPAAVQWCRWERHDDAEPVSSEPVALDADHMAHRYLARLENATVGFRWSF